MSFGNAIQAAVYTVLSADTAIGALATVYDDVPQPDDAGSGADFPYIVIGEDTLNAWDTDDSLGCEASITVHVWSRQAGRKQTKELQGLIYDALTRQEIAVSGYTLITLEWVSDQSFLDFDGRTRHGVSTFNITLDE